MRADCGAPRFSCCRPMTNICSGPGSSPVVASPGCCWPGAGRGTTGLVSRHAISTAQLADDGLALPREFLNGDELTLHLGQFAAEGALHGHHDLSLGCYRVEQPILQPLDAIQLVEEPRQHNGPSRIGTGRFTTVLQ